MINAIKYSRFLNSIAEEIDISPSKYQDAVNRYEAVGLWLERGDYEEFSDELTIYPQGSFRLGTVVRPIKNGFESSYDIDLVCELPMDKEIVAPRLVKSIVGDRIKEHGIYRQLLQEEGKRCWTLEYAEEDGIGFHLDILPAVPNPLTNADASIAITNKRDFSYSWSASNPKGYGVWFDNKNRSAFEFVLHEQKQSIQARSPDIFLRVEDVPNQLVRTPLQRAIQLMKRHRDVYFDDRHSNEYSPISIVITTLAGHFYRSELDTFTALSNIVDRLHAHAELIANQSINSTSPIKRTQDGKWYIGNPVNSNENFAERWHEDNHARAIAFFTWIDALNRDLVEIIKETRSEDIRKILSTSLGIAIATAHFELIVPVRSENIEVPKIHIPHAAKPWRV